jgi:hemoglobin
MKDISNREDIKLLIDTFYSKVQTNKELGYFFNDVAQVDWESHLPKMYDFWETILFHKAVYKGNPMKKHVALHQLAKLKKEHFEIWLGLFKTTVDELFEGDKTEQIKNRASSIATAIQLNTVYQKK